MSEADRWPRALAIAALIGAGGCAPALRADRAAGPPAASRPAAEPSFAETWDGYMLATEIGNYPLQFRITGTCQHAEAESSSTWPPTEFPQATRCKDRLSLHMKAFFDELDLQGEVRGTEASGTWRSGERQGPWRAWRAPFAKVAEIAATRQAAVDRLLDLMGPLYPFWQRKGMTPEELRARCSRVAATARTHQEFLSELGRVIADLKDGHTSVSNDPGLQRAIRGRVKSVLVEEVEGRFFVTQALAGVADLSHGPLEILSLDGMPPAERARELLREVPLSSGTPRHLREMVCWYLLAGPTDQPALLEVRDRQGQTQRLSVPRGGEPLPSVESRVLADNVGYIRIRRLDEGEGTLKAFVQALAALRSTSALLLDLRSNGGGTSLLAVAMLGRLVDKPQVFAQGTYPLGEGFGPLIPLPVEPMGQWQYEQPIVVLTNAGTYSTAEVLAAALKDSGRATVVGTPTGGGASNRITVCVSMNVWVSFATLDSRRANGQPFEGIGVEPDVIAAPRADDLLAGRDTVLEVALQEVARQRAKAPVPGA